MIDLIGGSGFIGTRLASRLESSASPFQILDKVPSKQFPVAYKATDVRDIESLRAGLSGGPVINLAAEHRDDVRPVSLYEDVNVRGAKNICCAASEKGVTKIIFTSSVAVYGFADPGTDESGEIAPFNEYGRSKYQAELVFRRWQQAVPDKRTLIIVRPTVVFGEDNRGNVYNLMHAIARGHFLMIGDGRNVKSMAYVENIAAFIEQSLSRNPGVFVYNYVDKPDLTVRSLVRAVREELGFAKSEGIRIPYGVGLAVGKALDLASWVSGRSFPISSVRIRKFCATTQFDASLEEAGFCAPVPLLDGLRRTLRHEFARGSGA